LRLIRMDEPQRLGGVPPLACLLVAVPQRHVLREDRDCDRTCLDHGADAIDTAIDFGAGARVSVLKLRGTEPTV
jgi:hypothetical protein